MIMSLHTTRIQSNSKFLVYRRFPPHIAARIPVNGNQTLSPVQIVAQTSHETGYEIVPIAEQLGIKATAVKSSLVVRMGDLVRFGTILAQRKKMFGRIVHITSPVEGIVTMLENGNLFIIRKPEEVNLRSLISSKVSQIILGKGVIMEVMGSRIQAVWSNSNEGAGKLKILSETAHESVQISYLDENLYNAIPVIGHFDRPELLESFSDKGAVGMIAGTVSPDAFQAAASWQHPFILTDGVGSNGIYPAIYDLLRENSGNHTALFNAQYGQSNRPQIVIESNSSPEEMMSNSKRQAKSPNSLKTGQKVRLLAGENRGAEGTVQKVYDWPQTISTGIKTAGVDIELINGEVTFVSTANLDIIM
jgi:hypothetical protein